VPLGSSLGFTNTLADILKNELHLGDRVEIKRPLSMAEESQLEISRDDKSPFVHGLFGDTEIRMDGGRSGLLECNGAYVAAVTHLYDHPKTGLSVNDNLMELRYFFDMLNRGGITPHRKVFATGYLPFLGSHSLPKYLKLGFIEPDRLDIFVRDLASVGIEDVFSIHPHAPLEFKDACKKNGIETHLKDTFIGPIETDYCKLRFRNREEARPMLSRMHPFTTRYEELAADSDKYTKTIGVVVDDGAERLMKMMVVGTNAALDYDSLLYFMKARSGQGKSRIIGTKGFSGVVEEQIKGARCILCDDIMRSGKSMNDVAKYLKERGAAYVEAWITHAECKERIPEKTNYIDKIIALGTMPHRVAGIDYIEGSAELILAASLFRNFCSYLENKGESLAFLRRSA
jgi:hypoxanthine-guanine phosphoribosyltransferase